MIRGTGLTLSDLVRDASLSVEPGRFTVLLGPNGAGKTSLIRLLLGLTQPDAGTTTLAALPAVERARKVAYLPQARPLAWPAKVRDVVALGRFAYGAAPGRLKGADAMAVDHAMMSADIAHLAERAADTLSGGEAARMHVARALASEARLIVADEPVAALDPRHQLRVLDLLAAHVSDGGGVLAVLHDLDLAYRYADRLVWMDGGRIVEEGGRETMTSERIASIYGVAAEVTPGGVRITGLA